MKTVGIVIIIVFIPILLMQLGMYFTSHKMKGVAIPDEAQKLLGNGAAGKALLYFYSPTCGPCRAMTPVIDNIIGNHLPAAKIDIHASPELAVKLGVRATPTTLIINNNVVEKVMLGAQPEQKLLDLLQSK